MREQGGVGGVVRLNRGSHGHRASEWPAARPGGDDPWKGWRVGEALRPGAGACVAEQLPSRQEMLQVNLEASLGYTTAAVASAQYQLAVLACTSAWRAWSSVLAQGLGGEDQVHRNALFMWQARDASRIAAQEAAAARKREADSVKEAQDLDAIVDEATGRRRPGRGHAGGGACQQRGA